jgi:hypothetical protein
VNATTSRRLGLVRWFRSSSRWMANGKLRGRSPKLSSARVAHRSSRTALGLVPGATPGGDAVSLP